MKRSIILFTILMSVLWACAPKIVKKSTEAEYSENLTKEELLPEIDTAAVAGESLVKAPYTPPEYDITNEIDVLLDSLAKDAAKKKVQVYTVQVYVGNNSQEADEARMKVFKILPDESPRIEWSQPNFRVKVGRFFSRLEAYKTLSTLRKHFPGALLVPERINLNN